MFVLQAECAFSRMRIAIVAILPTTVADAAVVTDDIVYSEPVTDDIFGDGFD